MLRRRYANASRNGGSSRPGGLGGLDVPPTEVVDGTTRSE
jgi:hypothetical protein